jgi:hypothetical protein
MRAGSISIALNKANADSKQIPTRRKGNDMIHTAGYSRSARTATGQHRTKSRHHKRNGTIIIT